MNCRNLSSIAFVSALFLASIPASAQDADDALRYSFLSPTGTARSLGFGSALGSIGGDFTSLSVNPAGIGIYRKSEFTFTPSVKFNSISGDYLNESRDATSARFNFNNAGAVFTNTPRGKDYDRSAWKAVSFGIGFNRLADFNRDYSYGGLMKGTGSKYSSFSEIFVEDAYADPTGVTSNDASLGYLGYQTYLVNDDTMGNFFTLANWEKGLNQLKSVKERGGINELAFSLGGNYEEKLMLGATVGVPFLRYTRDFIFREDDASGDFNNDFASFQYHSFLTTAGAGVNLKLGAIYKPADAFRIGVAVHTPTWYALSDVEDRDLIANTENYQGQQSVSAAQQRFSYRLTTPWRAIVSATGIIGKMGFITADYEYVDYAAMRYGFENTFSADENIRNRSIKNQYEGASNFRIGGEARLDVLALRAGFGYYGNPYVDKNLGSARTDFSGGIGIRGANMFADLSFTHSYYTRKDQPYVLNNPVVTVPSATVQNGLNNVALTVGFKF